MPNTRFAPSPTGYLHLGHAYAALYAHKKANGGRFVLRIEDIDGSRCRPEFVAALTEDLAWLGLAWEVPVRVQSEHFSDYRKALALLENMGLLYPCFCTRAEIQREVSNAMNAQHSPDGVLYPGTCRLISQSECADKIASGAPYSLRLDMAKAMERVGAVSWTEETRGRQLARPADFGDVVVARKDTPASYHLCVTIDDALQEIDLVTRGEDLFRATDVHRLIQTLLDLPEPTYSHHRLLLDESGNKFSKRDHAESLRTMREMGETALSVRRRLGF